MIRLKILFFVSILLLSSQAFNQIFLHRSLVVADGGLDDKDSSVYIQLIDLAGGAEKSPFANLFLEGLFSEKGVFSPELVGKYETCFIYVLNYIGKRNINYVKTP